MPHVLNHDESVRAAAAIRLALAMSAAIESLGRELGEEVPDAFLISSQERGHLACLADRLSPQVPA